MFRCFFKKCEKKTVELVTWAIPYNTNSACSNVCRLVKNRPGSNKSWNASNQVHWCDHIHYQSRFSLKRSFKWKQFDIRQLLLLFKDFSVQLPFSGSCLSKPHLHWLAMRSFWCHQPQSTRPTPSQHTDHHWLVNMVGWFSSKCRKLHFTCLPVVYCHMLSNIFNHF